MKQKMYFLWLWFFFLSSYAQPPQGIGYQSIARNASGTVIANATIAVRVSILKDPGYVLVYREVQHPATNADGLYSITIGNGTVDTGTFSTINWAAENKHLKIELDPSNGTTYPVSSLSAFMTAPYALYAKSAQSMTAFSLCDNIYALKSLSAAKQNDLVYMRGYYAPGDGGEGLFMWKTDDIFKTSTSGYYSLDNWGTIVQCWSSLDTGRWVRQYSGNINVAYFGTLGDWRESTVIFKAAIDFAKLVADGSPDYQSHFGSSTVFIPNGNYTADKITLRNGVDILGESIDRTSIRITCDSTYPHLFEIEPGMVRINVSNFTVSGECGNGTDQTKDIFYIQGQVGPFGAGGLTNSTFKNIIVQRFKGTGIYLLGGTGGFLPNDTTIFENVRVFRYEKENSSNYSLKIENDGRQYTFVNCQFDGGSNADNVFQRASKGYNIYIKGNDSGGYVNPNTITFLTSTIQNSDYGVYIDRAENINFDTCWFENLGVGIFVDGTNRPCKGINITNNRFANVPGYGAFDQFLDSSYKLTDAYCIMSKNSVVNATSNLTVCSELHSNCGFAYAYDGNLGMNLSGNSFTNDPFSKTYGTMQAVTQSGTTLDCKQNNEVSASGSGTIATITSTINTGEIVMIKASSTLVFSKIASGSNITFPGSTNTLTLSSGQIAEFIKTDLSGTEVFQLVRIKR